MSARFICIGTHHKTGTVWMRRVWHAVSVAQGIPLMQCNRPQKLEKAAESGPQIIVNWSSTFPTELIQMEHARFFHLIRDPRDVLLSGMRYHRVAPFGKERFLSKKKPAWGGKNYQEYLNSLSDDVARLKFEMRNKHETSLYEMLAWSYGHPNAVDVRYEDLIVDTDCKILRDALVRFEIEGLDIDKAVQSFWDYSLFGGLANNADKSYLHRLHVSSGSTAQWKQKLPREVAEVYAERYGGALRALGYAGDDAWVGDCRPAREIAAVSG